MSLFAIYNLANHICIIAFGPNPLHPPPPKKEKWKNTQTKDKEIRIEDCGSSYNNNSFVHFISSTDLRR